MENSSSPQPPAPANSNAGGVSAATAPLLVACAARSGSTLLRWLLDTHPDLTCPSETDLALLLNAYVRSATVLAGGTPPTPGQRARSAVDDLITTHLRNSGKVRFCDKSLSNVLHLDLLAETWPDARFLLLHRHCMDVVLSGIEASPWGLSDYGFAQTAPMSPTDSVVALTAYWLDRTAKMLSFERRHPDRCLRVRYEDLVTDSEASAQRLFAFIGVAHLSDVSSAAFLDTHDAFGPSDYKVWYTKAVHSASIGRGARVPPDRVGGALRNSLNELLAALDYAPVDDNWGAGNLATVPTGPPPAAPALDIDAELLELRVVEGHNVLWRGFVDLEHAAQVVDGHDGAAAAARSLPIVAIEKAALADVGSRGANVGAALRARTLRYYGPPLRNFAEERRLFDRLITFFTSDAERLAAELER